MSKSKKNTIDPENIISNYGADAARLFILSDSPPEKDVQWSEEGIISSFKFVQKLWNLHQKILDESNKNHKKNNMIKFILPAIIIFLIVLFWEKINETIYKKFNIKISSFIITIALIFLGIIFALLYF